ncbi:transcription factor A, mitochondrial-like isoform X2 [Pomacea canaliculata]|uniref:transcription factor A, mitochondrial-like isoform X2 n=1 Tax=Pomacea canaliculata TaxID=400727 RepID=UPI000D72C6C3|nr:transcription factor A, mitochondrial-like isoform X2 [Pomacea canaliculata]
MKTQRSNCCAEEDATGPMQDARCFISMSQSIQSPDAPKRPPGAFGKFVKEKCSEIQKNNPGSNGPEITKIASQLWRELGQEEKSVRKLLAQKEYEDYKQKYLMFLDGLSEQEKKVNLYHKFVKEAPVKKKEIKVLHGLGKPKMPLTSYALFLKASKPKRGNKSMAQYIKDLANDWHNITKEEKEIYEKDARVRKEKYMKELEEWEEKMKATGFQDFIRESSRNKPQITSVSNVPKKSSL